MRFTLPPPMTQAELRVLLVYDQESGELLWRTTSSGRGGHTAGRLAGHWTSSGYRRVTINKVRYLGHVLIWYMMNGEWLPDKIDHIDRNGGNNKWDNLRRANRSEQMVNARYRTSLMRGVSINKRISGVKGGRPYEAYLTIYKRRQRLGSYHTVEQAHAAYREAIKAAYGAFAQEVS